MKDDTLKDQLQVIQALQVDNQVVQTKKKMKSLNNIVKNNKDKVDVIIRGIVALPPPSGSGIDPSRFPLGFNKAEELDSLFSSHEGRLIITAVGRRGPPVVGT